MKEPPSDKVDYDVTAAEFQKKRMSISVGREHPKRGIKVTISDGKTSIFLPFRTSDDVVAGFSDRSKKDHPAIDVNLRDGGTFFIDYVLENDGETVSKVVGYLRGRFQVYIVFTGKRERRFDRLAAQLVKEVSG